MAAITEELGGHEFSASSISTITVRLDTQLAEFSRRPLREAFPYVVVDARYERVREGGVIVSRAILIALALTDCISFVAMKDEGLTDALTGDRHFEQAGFRALLK